MSKGWSYESGNWNIVCDVCGKKTKASDVKQRWDGLLVCKEDYEVRHSMDFIRARVDKISVPFTRPQSTDTFNSVLFCNLISRQARAGYATAGCAIVGNTGENGFCGANTSGVTQCFETEYELRQYRAT